MLQKGIAIVLLNLNGTAVEAQVALNNTRTLWHRKSGYAHRHSSRFVRGSGAAREEYHLTPEKGNLQSQTMLLNGNVLSVDSSGDIPALDPLHVNPSTPIRIAPFSIVFAHLPYIRLSACS